MVKRFKDRSERWVRGLLGRSAMKGNEWPFYAVLVLASAASAAVSVAHPALGVTLAATICAGFLLRNRSAVYAATIAVTFGAWPLGFPQSLPAHLLVYEPLLLVSSWMAYRTMRDDHPEWRWLASLPFVAMSTVVLFGIVEGRLRGNSHVELLHDARNLVGMLLATILAAGIRSGPNESACLRAVGWTLWGSLGTTLLASVGALQIVGRDLANDGTGGASRLITPATFLALATACVCVSLWQTGSIGPVRLSYYLIPSLLLLLVSFQRNNLLAIAIVIIWTAVISRSVGVALSTAWRALAAVAIVAGILSLAPTMPGGAWATEQVAGFEQRVLGGISQEARSRDGSALYRVREIREVKPVIAERPFVGGGFGAAYKWPEGRPGSFLATRAPYYVHNFYYWIVLKVGFVGLFGFLIYLGIPILRSLRDRSPRSIALSGTIVAFAGISTVAPIPIGSPTGVLLGAVVGALVRVQARRSRAHALQEPRHSAQHLMTAEPALGG
jgi:O-antigen ligase